MPAVGTIVRSMGVSATIALESTNGGLRRKLLLQVEDRLWPNDQDQTRQSGFEPNRRPARPAAARSREEEMRVKITYDTVTDSISCPDLNQAQTAELQRQLSAALIRNDPVRTVASNIVAFVKATARAS